MPSDNEMLAIIQDPALSSWLRNALISALDRAPVDAANDAALLSMVLNYRACERTSKVQAELAVLRAQKKR